MTQNPNRLLATKSHDNPRGFALVISLSLMVLLTVLAVGLLSLSTISLRSSTQGDAMAEARANARLAMYLAIGELQHLAGPDQRVTAAADLAGTNTGDSVAAGAAPANNTTVTGAKKGLSALQPGTRHWTGVWRNTNVSTPGTEIYTKTPAPTHMQWLVSGNETSGQPTFTPSSQSLVVGQDGKASDQDAAVVLVGPGSAGAGSASAADNYVAAPLVKMAPTSTGSNAGRYAWWIGDEGVKAKINPSGTLQGGSATYASLATQRAGWEVVKGLESYPTPDMANFPELERVVTVGQSELIDKSITSGSTTPRALFHTATSESFGVLADNLQGGLRIDLTALLEKGIPSTPLTGASFPNSPALNANLVPTTISAARLLKGPKWSRLANFYTQARSVASSKKLTVTATADASGLTIAPAIIDLRLLFGAKMVKKSATDYEVHPCGKIAVALANPYPYTLQWPTNLELTMIDETPATNNISSRIYDSAGNAGYFSNKGAPAVFNNTTFVIPSGELAPGEAKAFTMGGQVIRRFGNLASIKVDLKPFSTSSPNNFDNCVIQEETAVNTGSKTLDVRESWTTTQVSAELRLGSGRSTSNLLRRLERFELDNGFFAETRRPVTAATAESMTRPFPLKLYAFQMSQPGMDYAALMPSPDLLGTRGSTLRTFTDFNLQAVRVTKPITSYNPPPFFMEASDSLATLPFATPGGDTGNGFTRNLAVTPLAWGRSSVGSVKKTVLFSMPEHFVSLAQLQHVDLTADDTFTSIAHQAGNAVGNSYATPFVKRNLTIQKRDNYVVTGRGGGESETATKTSASFYDMSYLLNTALWDSYFFSTCEGGGTPLNHSMVVTKESPELKDPVKASAHLLVNGAFNVNSTNKDAWKALLAGNRFLKHPADGTGGGVTDALFPRSLEQLSPGQSSPSGTADDSFSGFRRLSNDQIDAVAEEIVKQVRLRGPFLSLSHFVNRSLAEFTTRNRANIPLSSAGALQCALDNGGANISPNGSKSGFARTLAPSRDKVLLKPGSSSSPKADLWGDQMNGSRGSTYGGMTEDRFPVWAGESKDLNPGSVASIYADRPMITDSSLQYEQGYRSTGIPGWLTQADLLQAIGPVISARSDTFRIRCYGEARTPDGKSVTARAWCEAVVQRQPEYLDASNSPSDRATTSTPLSPINQNFGRRFSVSSFRWLSKDEI
jgi:Tfp pilus assembly protein PilX